MLPLAPPLLSATEESSLGNLAHLAREAPLRRSAERLTGEVPARRAAVSFGALLGFGLAAAGAAALGAVATRAGLPWYRGLRKPSFTPPEAVFGPVWTGLYALSAVSGWRVWKAPPSPARSRALSLWFTQLALNAAWSPLFFGARRPVAAVADIAALGGALGAYSLTAAKVDRTAAWLHAPYVAWVGFATALNVSVARKNASVTAG